MSPRANALLFRPRRIALVLAIALGAALPREASGQSGGGANLLASPWGWPTTGAASEYTALGLDPYAVYLNPAGLSMQDERSALVQFGNLQLDTSWDLAAVSYPIPGLGALGLGIARIGTSGLEAYDAQNQPLGEYGYRETSIAASIARRIRGPIHAGATFKVLSQSLGDVSAAAPSIDLGFAFKPEVLRGAQVGVAIQNVLAGSLDLGGPAPGLEPGFRLGVAGPAWRLGRLSGLRAVADLARTGGQGIRTRAGLELTRAGWGAVRAALEGGRAQVGVGINFRRYGLDLAITQGELETTQQVALRAAWGEPVSRYEERRRAEYTHAAEESLRARNAAQVARDREAAEAAEARGDWETALLLWEVLARERPEDAAYLERANRARGQISIQARKAVEAESARRLGETVAGLTRAALARGDFEEAAGLWRAVAADAPEAALGAEVRAARDRAADRALERTDSLRAAGRVLAAVEEAALALRLRPDDPRAKEAWASLEALVGKSAATAASLGRKLEALTAVQQASQAFNEGRYGDAQSAVNRAILLDPQSAEARAWRDRIARRLSTPKPELDARIKRLYVQGMEAFTAGDYRAALRHWEQILALDPLNESARRNVLEARERLKAEARR
jgi:hypothetical protein